MRRVLQAPTLPAAGPCLNFVEAVLNQPCTRPAPPPLPRLAAALFELDAPPLDPGTANETTAVTAATTAVPGWVGGRVGRRCFLIPVLARSVVAKEKVNQKA